MEHTHHQPTDDNLATPRAYHRPGSSLLDEYERRLLATWNDTQQSCPQGLCVPQLVALQSAERPDAPAVVMGHQTLTYQELNRRANRLAHHLRALGVEPDTLVAVCLERSPDLVVALLAALKAGAAYLPLDPGYPPERLAFMLEDAQPRALVTRASLTSLTGRPIPQSIQLVRLDADADALARQSEAERDSDTRSEQLAYVIYTSGSTGQPKGVEICHSSLLNLVYWHRNAFGVTARDRTTQFASPSFDAAGWEVWPSLTCGACVFMAEEDTRLDPVALRNWLVAQKITLSFLPTPLAERVIALEWPESSSLRVMLTGGDTLHTYPPRRLPFTLVNNYGPTEATVVATSAAIPPATSASAAAGCPPIGRPIANTEIYLLDERLQQVPIGAPGELYIGGAGLARGYLHRPELTQERFIVHPFKAEAGARLYRTGDLARYAPDGQIIFLGRADEQIKLRGYRIELDEIASALDQIPDIQASCVVAREETPGDQQLVAYLVAAPGATLGLRPLTNDLATWLPEYMIPSVFVALDTLPLTANGKVDRAALPAPDATNTLRDDAVVAPTTPVEERLVAIVAATLGLDAAQVGVDDNFFLLGGHSLSGTQVITRIADTFGVELSLHALFATPTIAELSLEVERLIFAKLDAMSEDEIQSLLTYPSEGSAVPPLDHEIEEGAMEAQP